MRWPARSILYLIIFMALFPVFSARAAGAIGDDQADVVWGQYGTFLTNGFNQARPAGYTGSCPAPAPANACTLDYPGQIAFDGAGNLWVADEHNNRVLMYSPGSTVASKVFGQSNFTAATANNGGAVSATGMDYPFGVAVDSRGTLFVSDYGNNRVLVFFNATGKANGAAADLVVGQPSFTTNTPNTVGASQTSLAGPYFLGLDAAGDLLVADHDNSRVLFYPASNFNPSAPAAIGTIAATMSWGQMDSFTTTGSNQQAPSTPPPGCPPNNAPSASPCTLSAPSAVIADAQGDLFIADTGNNRVLEYDGALSSGSQAATMVYGQYGSFTSSGVSPVPPSGYTGPCPTLTSLPTPCVLYEPYGLTLDAGGNLWVADNIDNRVVEFPPPITTNRTAATVAIGVLGQHGQLNSAAPNSPVLDAGSLDNPVGVTSNGSSIFVSDYSNHRLLSYNQPYPIQSRLALAQGWNLVALPSTAQLSYTASSVVSSVNAQGGNAAEVAVYANGSYHVFVPGYATDFTITSKQGFWVLATKPSIWAVS